MESLVSIPNKLTKAKSLQSNGPYTWLHESNCHRSLELSSIGREPQIQYLLFTNPRVESICSTHSKVLGGPLISCTQESGTETGRSLKIWALGIAL